MQCWVKVAFVVAAVVDATQAFEVPALAGPPVELARQAAQHGSKEPRSGPSRRPSRIGAPQRPTPGQKASALAPESTPAMARGPTGCDLGLAKIAGFDVLGEIVGPGECRAPDAVLLRSVILRNGSKVAIKPAATLRCPMAEAVAQWVRRGVAQASMRLGVQPRELEDWDSYDCRTRDGVPGAKLSEHGRANALDVRGFEVSDGKTLVLADPKVPEAWRLAVRAAACARFTTVLGPGADSYHAEHVHIDLAARRNHYRICEWDVRGPAPVVQAGSATATAADAVPLPRPRPLTADASQRSPIVPHVRRRRR